MKRGGGNSEHVEGKRRKIDGQDAIQNKKKMKKNMQRLGGRGGLSLESFANAKTMSDKYNPALIKKQREFYKNAKCVNKYKKSIKQEEQQNVGSTSWELSIDVDDETKKDNSHAEQQNKKIKKKPKSLEELYKKKHAEEEKARMERETVIQAKKEQIQQAEARRRGLKEKMYKKTRSGQPVMKYRIEHLLETISSSTS